MILFVLSVLALNGVGSTLIFVLGGASFSSKLFALSPLFIGTVFTAYFWTVLLRFSSQRTTRLFHGCEHKVITLLGADLSLTRANLKKCSKTHIRCGTSIISFFVNTLSGFFFLLSLILAGTPMQELPDGTIDAGLPIHVLVIYFITFLIYTLFLSFFGQLFFTVSEPTEEVIEEGLEAATRARTVLTQLQNTP